MNILSDHKFKTKSVGQMARDLDENYESPWARMCQFCDGRKHPDGESCGNPACMRAAIALDQGYADYYAERDAGALRAVLRRRCRDHDNYRFALGLPKPGDYELVTLSYRPLARLFYTFKAAVCLISPRWLPLPGSKQNLNDVDYDEIIDNVAIWKIEDAVGEASSYGGQDWMKVDVGRGVLRGWWVSIESDSSY